MSHKSDKRLHKTQVLIIGGGVTGTGLARDLALRGIHSILAERRDINAGASGANHGLLHSGARYIASDGEAARECGEENKILKKIAPHCIEDTGGIFVAVKGDDESYIAQFPDLCTKYGISAISLEIKDARELEPVLSENIVAAYLVKDGSIDPFKLSLENISHAQRLGSIFFKDTEVIGFKCSAGRIQSTLLRNAQTGEETTIEADVVVNASGAWAKNIASLANIPIDIVYSKGTLLVTSARFARRVLNRLRKASDSDIIVPGGTVSILGTTSVRILSLDNIYPSVDEVDQIIEGIAQMAPALEAGRYIRAFSGVRALVNGKLKDDDRNVSRRFALIDHAQDGIDNFITITGGKLTTYRLMAEKTADLICQHLLISAACKTMTEPLPDTQHGQWTKPGLAPRMWSVECDTNNSIICECELVPKSVIDNIVSSIQSQNSPISLNAIGLRSRIGKGPCQGAFCSIRLAAHICDQHDVKSGSLIQLKNFLNERWLGQHTLFWDLPLLQSELMEAIHCGLFNLELTGNDSSHA